LANGTLALPENPDKINRLRDNPDLIKAIWNASHVRTRLRGGVFRLGMENPV
jgi:hypothetical protein